jgi:hypothetical protein
METIALNVPEKEAFIVPIGDVHIGDVNFGKEGQTRLKEKLDFVRKHKNAYIFLMGDILNVATTASASAVFEQNQGLSEQIETAYNMFKDFKGRIIGGISGNHENRMHKFAGYNPMMTLCSRLGCKYLGYSAVTFITVGKKNNNSRMYVGYFHHTTGGGSTPGSALNRIDKLRNIVVDADFYVGGHSHTQVEAGVGAIRADRRHKKVVFMRQELINSGSYLEWDGGYAEEKQLQPSRLGSPIIILRDQNGNGWEVKR